MNQLTRSIALTRALVTLIRDPNRLEMVFELRDSLADPKIMDQLVEKLSKDPRIALSFIQRHRLKIDLDALSRLPEGTLGRAYAENMRRLGLDPAAIPVLSSNNPRDFFSAHLYETHDLWHTLTGFATDVAGELGLQAFYMAQIGGGLPIALLTAGAVNTALLSRADAANRMDEIARGWQMGRAAKPIFGVHWDELWAVPLAEVRRRFDIAVPSREANHLDRGSDGARLAA